MDKIFGLPMAGIMVGLLLALTICLLSVAWVAWRRPVIFKMGMRNIPRRRAQTTLIVVGLMLSTLIISAALGTGDTMSHSVSAEVYRTLGPADELIVASQDGKADAAASLTRTFPAAKLAQVEQAVAGDGSVDGLLPMLVSQVPVVHEAKGQAEPQVYLVGLDPARQQPFGPLRDGDGRTIDMAALPANAVVLSQAAAEKLDAHAGDTITVFYANQPTQLTVFAVAPDSLLSGTLDFGSEGMVMPLDRLQALTGQPGTLSAIAVSNAGGTRDGLAHSEAVTAKLRAALAGSGLGVDELKQRLVDQTTGLAELFTGLFLVLGLFSIAAGILLIVLIFTMLAAERRSEMGMARAVGTQRRQLIQQFVAEGAGYALLAGLVGAGLGVAASWAIATAMGALFGDFIAIEPHITPRSLIVAYSLGVVITFLAVVGSSWKISRLSVVAAVRDIPDAANPRRKTSVLVWGGLLTIVGAWLALSGLGAAQAAPLYLGLSLVPFGLALALRFFGAPNRPVYSAVGLFLLVLWLLPGNVQDALFGKLDGDIELFFLSGIFMVIGATILILQNTDVLLAGVSRLGGVFQSKLPAIRTAVAYPGAAKGRTGLTVAMFSLIVFSLVMIATLNQNFTALFLGDKAAAGWDVRADQGEANPVGNFPAALQAAGVDTSHFRTVGTVTNPLPFAAQARVAGTQAWQAPWAIKGMDDAFIAGTRWAFSARATGYADDAAVVQALRTQPGVAVVDAAALDSPNGFGSDHMGERFRIKGLKPGTKSFAPVQVEVARPDGSPATLTIIGIIDDKITSLTGIYASQQTIAAIYPAGQGWTSFYVALAGGASADQVAKQVEAALLPNGVQGADIKAELADQQRQSTAFLSIIEGFMGLGLLVGIAAVGVIAFRMVVERRQQIGMLRALGYQRAMVALSFLIETGFIVGLGVLSGGAMGLLLARNLFTDGSQVDSSGTSFTVPWPLLLMIAGATIAAALLMTWIPARQASRVAPAEALRYE